MQSKPNFFACFSKFCPNMRVISQEFQNKSQCLKLCSDLADIPKVRDLKHFSLNSYKTKLSVCTLTLSKPSNFNCIHDVDFIQIIIQWFEWLCI